MWQRNVVGPVSKSGKLVPELILLPSPFRYVLGPLVEHILKVEREHPDRQIAVLVPELVVKHWWQNLLHNQRAQLLKAKRVACPTALQSAHFVLEPQYTDAVKGLRLLSIESCRAMSR
jgi:hypothetical protein